MLQCETMSKFFHSTLLQFTQLYEYLAIDNGGYLYEHPSHINLAGCFPEKSRWCLTEQTCQGSKVYSALSSPVDWIMCYIRTYLFYKSTE